MLRLKHKAECHLTHLLQSNVRGLTCYVFKKNLKLFQVSSSSFHAKMSHKLWEHLQLTLVQFPTPNHSTKKGKKKSFGWPLSHSPFEIFNLSYSKSLKIVLTHFCTPEVLFLEDQTVELRRCSSSKLFWELPNELHTLNISEYKKEQDLSQSTVRQKYQLIRNFRDSFGSNSLTWHIMYSVPQSLHYWVLRPACAL